eukprot:3171949-Rhodomonas_salina.1
MGRRKAPGSFHAQMPTLTPIGPTVSSLAQRRSASFPTRDPSLSGQHPATPSMRDHSGRHSDLANPPMCENSRRHLANAPMRDLSGRHLASPSSPSTPTHLRRMSTASSLALSLDGEDTGDRERRIKFVLHKGLKLLIKGILSLPTLT